MKNRVYMGFQILSGLMLVVFGLNGFLHFMPMPEAPQKMAEYMGTLFSTGYIFPIVATVQTAVGISFLLNKFVPLTAIILMPIMINAFLAHLFLDIAGIGGSFFILVSIVIVMIKNGVRYKEIFKS